MLAQTYTHWECILINDGSYDNTAAVADEYAKRDPRIHSYRQNNQGLPSSRNRGLEVATGDYVQFLDADDLIAPTKLEKQLGALEKVDGLTVAYCDYCFTTKDGPSRRLDSPHDRPRFLMSRPVLDIATRWEISFSIPIHSFLFDARFFKQLGIDFDETLPTHEDWDCWLHVFALEPTVIYVAGELATYRVDGSGMAQNIGAMRKGFLRACLKHETSRETSVDLRSALRETRTTMLRYYRHRREAQLWNKLPARARQAFTRYVPWPIQRFVKHLLGLL